MGFEAIVRPAVMPNIRPAKTPTRALQEGSTSTADPEKGMAVIRGNGFHQGTTSYNWSGSSSSSRPVEVKRRADTARVYQVRDDESVNKENFVDIKVTNKMWKRGGAGAGMPQVSAEEKEQRQRDAKLYEQWTEFYKRQKEQRNIEIKKRDEVEDVSTR